MSAQLLPCPFCGGETMFENDGGRWSVGCIDASGECYGFQSLTTFARQADATTAWNTRAPNAAADALAKALEEALVGGNHLAHVLIGKLGAGFAERFPPDMDHETALHSLCATDEYDVWCCWRAMMNARTALAAYRAGAA